MFVSPLVKFCSPYGNQSKWKMGKGQLECQLRFPGNTPLDLARRNGRTEIVNLLMEKASWLHG